MTQATVNRPAAKTFGWLGMNGTAVALPAAEREQSHTLAAGETRTVVLDGGAPVLCLSAVLGDGAELRLIQLRRGAAPCRVSEISVRCGAGARFFWYRVVLGGAETYDSCSVALEGEGSAFTAELGYRLRGDEKLDINCEAIHTGRNTRSAIRASGALSERASKLLRGTIDLRAGCAGAVGNETEDVLLLDDGVRNRSMPVILCGEEDVEGNHGASIGRLDGEQAFYLASRGIPEDAARELVARAKLDAVVRRLPDKALRAELLGEGDGA